MRALHLRAALWLVDQEVLAAWSTTLPGVDGPKMYPSLLPMLCLTIQVSFNNAHSSQ